MKIIGWIILLLLTTNKNISARFTNIINPHQQTNQEIYDLIYNAYSKGNVDYQIVKTYIDSLSSSELSDTANIRILYDFIVYKDTNYLDIHSNSFRFFVNNKNRFNKFFDSTQVNVRIGYVALQTARKAIEKKDKQLLAEAIEFLKPIDNMFKSRFGRFQYIGNDRTKKWIDLKWQSLRLWMKYYHRMNDTTVYDKLEKMYTSKYEYKNMEAMMVLCWDYYKEFENKGTEKEYLTKALFWSVGCMGLDDISKKSYLVKGEWHPYAHYVNFIENFINYKVVSNKKLLIEGILYIPSFNYSETINTVEDLSILFSEKDKHDKEVIAFIKINIIDNVELDTGENAKKLKEKCKELIGIVEGSE